ncbi:MAG: 16S rRNA (cytidine(1402)-2'-O)-methyltransferase [Clostridia bacterium]|nr:16S rRNA (cytidine(1402)-2'-O)-methyltransferase [Clostridia bacterium]
MAGKLYLVATPIGNLEDMTLRAIRILGEVDLIAAEDTRVSGRLLKHFEISKPLISYFEHNKRLRGEFLLRELQEGKDIALICDAGTPGLSDPGADIVAEAVAAGIEVIAIPGASALLPALTVSGLSRGGFRFIGFLPRDKSGRRRELRALAEEQSLMVFYEAPHRLPAMLADLAEAFGAERRLAVCRELTKMFEEIRRGTLAEMIEHFATRPPRGEFTLVVAGAEYKEPADIAPWLLERELRELLDRGLSRKEAAREVAGRHRLRVNKIYQLGLKEETDYAGGKND